jgi:hypothetical protein
MAASFTSPSSYARRGQGHLDPRPRPPPRPTVRRHTANRPSRRPGTGRLGADFATVARRTEGTSLHQRGRARAGAWVEFETGFWRARAAHHPGGASLAVRVAAPGRANKEPGDQMVSTVSRPSAMIVRTLAVLGDLEDGRWYGFAGEATGVRDGALAAAGGAAGFLEWHGGKALDGSAPGRKRRRNERPVAAHQLRARGEQRP